MRRYHILMIITIMMFHYTSAQEQQNNSNYIIYDAAQHTAITLAALKDHIPSGSILIFGEQHDDSTGHVLESRIFEMLSQKFNNDIVLTMEMLESDIQPVVDEYLSGLISEKNFRKEARTWNNYDDYRLLVEYAKQQGIRVIAANAPARYVNLVTRRGLSALHKLSRQSKKYIAPLPVDTLSGNYHTRFLEAMGGHTIPGMHLYESQNLWDATMAYFIHKAQRKYKPAVVMQLNGRFHSDYHSGIAERLHQRKNKIITISCFPAADLKQEDRAQYESLADYIILTKQ